MNVKVVTVMSEDMATVIEIAIEKDGADAIAAKTTGMSPTLRATEDVVAERPLAPLALAVDVPGAGAGAGVDGKGKRAGPSGASAETRSCETRRAASVS